MPRSVRGKRRIVAGVALSAALVSGCGGTRQDASEPSGDFPMRVVKASFPAQQRLSDHTRMVISVRNEGRKTVPIVAVTLLDPKLKTQAGAFGDTSNEPDLASRSRPIWIVDQGPLNGDTAYSNTWALGPLAPGKTETFIWSVTPLKPGAHTILYRVAAGLNGKAKAVVAGGRPVEGKFRASISTKPAAASVDAAGNVVTQP